MTYEGGGKLKVIIGTADECITLVAMVKFIKPNLAKVCPISKV